MPFLITLFAGFSTLVGYLFIYLKNDNNSTVIKALSFSSGVMISMSLFDLIPESINILNSYYFNIYSIITCFICIVFGIIISIFINSIINYGSKLFKVGLISMIAIIIHNIPEGIVTFLTSSYNIKMGIIFALAISFHNIPEGISISVPIYFSTNSKLKAFVYTFISSISEFIGALIAFIFFKNMASDLLIGYLYSFIAGIMLYISLDELLPLSLSYKQYLKTILFFIIGLIFMFITILIL